jgi:hypothetical protein
MFLCNSPGSRTVPPTDLRQRTGNCIVSGGLNRNRIHLCQTRFGFADHWGKQPTEEPIVCLHVKYHESHREGTVLQHAAGSSDRLRKHTMVLIDEITDLHCPFYLYTEFTNARRINCNTQVQSAAAIDLSRDTNRKPRKKDDRKIFCALFNKPVPWRCHHYLSRKN